LQVHGTDPDGGPILYAIAHETEATVDVPEEASAALHFGAVLLKPPRPNPFQGSTRLAFELREPR